MATTATDGRICGYVILFSTAATPDAQGEYFPSDGNYGPFVGSGVAVDLLYDHGIPRKGDPIGLALGNEPIGEMTLVRRDRGIWGEGRLDLAIPAVKALHGRAESGANLGYSTGSTRHVIQRRRVGSVYENKKWPIAEVSVTDHPVCKDCRLLVGPDAAKARLANRLDDEDAPRRAAVARIRAQLDADPSIPGTSAWKAARADLGRRARASLHGAQVTLARLGR